MIVNENGKLYETPDFRTFQPLTGEQIKDMRANKPELFKMQGENPDPDGEPISDSDETESEEDPDEDVEVESEESEDSSEKKEG